MELLHIEDTYLALKSVEDFGKKCSLVLTLSPQSKGGDCMKKLIVLALALVCLLGLVGCNKDSMDYIIENEPSVTGIVEEVHDNSIIIHCEQLEGYPDEAKCSVSLDVENEDSMTHFDVGDEVVVYYNGDIAESDPLQINTVYAITLRTPANRETE